MTRSVNAVPPSRISEAPPPAPPLLPPEPPPLNAVTPYVYMGSRSPTYMYSVCPADTGYVACTRPPFPPASE